MYNRSGVVLMCLICIVWPVTVFADIASGLVGYWSFDNSADIGADGSGYGHNGTVNGNGITQTTGLQGRAAAFDGASVIEISATTLLNPTNAITVSFWYKSTQSASGGPFSIVRHDTHFTAGQLRDSQNLSTIAFDSTGTRFMVSTIWNGILNNGMWHHVAAAYGNGTYNLYVDGQWAAGIIV
jgi:hypothetical protein